MNEGELGPFWLSIRVASLATLGVVVAGLPLAFVLARRRFPGKGLLTGLLMLPLVLPPTVMGYWMLQVIGRRAWLGIGIERLFGGSIVFHWTGAVLASGVAAFPLFLLPARGAIEEVDPRLEAAARMLGRRELSIFLDITLPLSWRGIVAGTLLAFVRALGDFGATLMVAGDLPGRTRTASLAIYDAVYRGDSAQAARLTLLVSAVALLALWVAQRTLPRRGPRD